MHGQSLLRDWHGKTIVLANAPFHTALGTRYADQFLSQMDLIKAAESHGIRVLVLNDNQHEIGHLFGERLIPTDGQAGIPVLVDPVLREGEAAGRRGRAVQPSG